jgi:two-component system, cell cycle sensor histidine kinase and response regulator CckA
MDPVSRERRRVDRSSLPRGSETVLIVEDESIVRDVAVRILEKQGYRVFTARDGLEAMKRASEKVEIDLLLTDVVLPGMKGPQIAENVLALHPTMKVLYMSGYTSDSIVSRGLLQPGIAFIEKSFTAAALCQKVREVLDRSLSA